MCVWRYDDGFGSKCEPIPEIACDALPGCSFPDKTKWECGASACECDSANDDSDQACGDGKWCNGRQCSQFVQIGECCSTPNAHQFNTVKCSKGLACTKPPQDFSNASYSCETADATDWSVTVKQKTGKSGCMWTKGKASRCKKRGRIGKQRRKVTGWDACPISCQKKKKDSKSWRLKIKFVPLDPCHALVVAVQRVQRFQPPCEVCYVQVRLCAAQNKRRRK